MQVTAPSAKSARDHFQADDAGSIPVVRSTAPGRWRYWRQLPGVFLAGYSGATLDAYRLDLRQWVTRLSLARHAVEPGRYRHDREQYDRASHPVSTGGLFLGRL